MGLCNATSTSPRRKFESELRPAAPSAISYLAQWKKLFATKNFTGSLGPDRETVSYHLRRARLEQKGRRHRRSGFRRLFQLHRFLCHLFGQLGAAAESDRQRNRNAVERRSRLARGGSRRFSGELMDRSRFPRGRNPHLPSRQARILQPGRLVGRRDAGRLGNDRDRELAFADSRNYFGDAAGAGVAPPACGDFTSINSTSKIRTEFGGIPGRPCSP